MATDCANVNCYVAHAVENLEKINGDIGYWTNLNLLIQICVVVLGVLATVIIALQGDANKYWTRPVGIVATALVTGLTASVTQFHIPDNIDKLIDVYQGIAQRTNAFEQFMDEHGIAKDAPIPASLSKDSTDYSNDVNALIIQRMRVKGTAGRLDLGTGPIGSKPVDNRPKAP